MDLDQLFLKASRYLDTCVTSREDRCASPREFATDVLNAFLLYLNQSENSELRRIEEELERKEKELSELSGAYHAMKHKYFLE